MTVTEDLTQLAITYRNKVQECADMIKLLSGNTPDNSRLVFMIGTVAVDVIPITDDNADFCMGFFMAWHQHYGKKLKEVTATMEKLQSGAVAPQ